MSYSRCGLLAAAHSYHDFDAGGFHSDGELGKAAEFDFLRADILKRAALDIVKMVMRGASGVVYRPFRIEMNLPDQAR